MYYKAACDQGVAEAMFNLGYTPVETAQRKIIVSVLANRPLIECPDVQLSTSSTNTAYVGHAIF